jgi:hypothetical protein
MRLDHVSYVTSHDQLADTANRLGSRLGTTFFDGGIHPRFGTRNFTAPLLDGRYIEVVCPIDHPSTEQTQWGKAVSKKAQDGGGWLTWVFSTKNISSIEEKFGYKAVEGHRTRPDGTDLRWKQIGDKEITESPELPFFIEWLTNIHPSEEGNPVARIKKIVISEKEDPSTHWLKNEIEIALQGIEIDSIDPKKNNNEKGILEIILTTSGGEVILQ